MEKFALKALMVGSLILGPNSKSWAQQDDIGKLEYQYSCAACHGADGKGNGPLAVAEQLTHAPPDLTVLARNNGGIFPLNAIYETIDGRQEIKAHGTRDMPIWGYRYTPSPAQALRPDPTDLYSDFMYNSATVVRSRILTVIDYLHRIQEK
jgi:hypothetical protein